ncbi:MAG: DUF4239 domain-containing protein [Ignavibacteria bacterium]
MNFLLDLHPLISFPIVCIVCVVITVYSLKFVRKRFHEEQLRENHEVAGIVFNAFGLVFAVLVAFVVFATWTSYDSSKQSVEMEAEKLSDLYLDADAFPDSMKKEIRVAITEYTRAVVEQEWPVMAEGGRMPQAVIEALRRIWNVFLNVDVKSLPNTHIYDESLKQLNSMSENRRSRWFASRASMPGVIWLVLIAGGAISVVYTFFFGIKRAGAHYLMTGVLTVINAMVLFLIFILNHPFSGYNAISSDPLRSVLFMFQRMLGH